VPTKWEDDVPSRILTSLLVGSAALLVGSGLHAQQAAPPDLDAVPDKMPFSTPYGPPIGAELAQSLVQAAAAEATKKGWPEDIAVVDSGGNLVAFLRMDGALLASIAISQHKARAAVEFRRPTKVFENAVVKSGFNYVLSLDGVIASRGGIPLVQDGKIIGAIGCSGGTGSQDEAICTAGAASVNK
jgi:glc operon protein GlcG